MGVQKKALLKTQSTEMPNFQDGKHKFSLQSQVKLKRRYFMEKRVDASTGVEIWEEGADLEFLDKCYELEPRQRGTLMRKAFPVNSELINDEDGKVGH